MLLPMVRATNLSGSAWRKIAFCPLRHNLETQYADLRTRSLRPTNPGVRMTTEASSNGCAVTVLREIVAPELRSLAAGIVEKGDHAEVQEHLDSDSAPGLSLSFQPLTRDKLTPVPPSKLDFSHGPTGALSVRTQIWGQQGEVSQLSIAGIASAPVALDKVDRTWVETQVTSFVRSVQKAN